MPAPGVDALFVESLKALEKAKGVSPAAIELLEAAALRSEPSVKEALAATQKAIAGGDDKLAKWLPALEGGDQSCGRSSARMAISNMKLPASSSSSKTTPMNSSPT